MDDRPYAPKPDPGKYELALADKTPAERKEYKAQVHLDEFEKQSSDFKQNFFFDGVTVNLASSLATLTDKSGNILGFEVTIASAQNEKGQELPIGDGVFQFVNPPLKVTDGTYHLEQDASGNDVKVANFKEDPIAAFQSILVTAIKGVQ